MPLTIDRHSRNRPGEPRHRREDRLAHRSAHCFRREECPVLTKTSVSKRAYSISNRELRAGNDGYWKARRRDDYGRGDGIAGRRSACSRFGDAGVRLHFAAAHSAQRLRSFVRGLLTPDPQRRIELFKDAIRLHPQYTTAMYHLGRAYSIDMDYKASNTLLEKIPDASPQYPQGLSRLRLNHYRLGKYERASAAFSWLPPIYDVLVNLGAAHAARGDSSGAQLAWRSASDRDRFGSEAVFNLAYRHSHKVKWPPPDKRSEPILRFGRPRRGGAFCFGTRL